MGLEEIVGSEGWDIALFECETAFVKADATNIGEQRSFDRVARACIIFPKPLQQGQERLAKISLIFFLHNTTHFNQTWRIHVLRCRKRQRQRCPVQHQAQRMIRALFHTNRLRLTVHGRSKMVQSQI